MLTVHIIIDSNNDEIKIHTTDKNKENVVTIKCTHSYNVKDILENVINSIFVQDPEHLRITLQYINEDNVELIGEW